MASHVAVVIPCYKVRRHILSVIKQIGETVSQIYVVDDGCPEKTGLHVQEVCSDLRVKVIFHSENQGIGGAMVTGYREALAGGAEVIVKLDGDGQMDPALIARFVEPIRQGLADYTKGNRFFALEHLHHMPWIRIVGNAILSVVNKAASGYWNIMDPTNGYTAIHASVLAMLPLDKIDKGYFFESSMLFRLNILRAVVSEIPMAARYGDEQSNLNIGRVSLQFPLKYLSCTLKRIFYNYFLRDFNICSLELVSGSVLMLAGTIFGLYHWHLSNLAGVPATTGTVMLAAVPVILGFQLLLSALSFDAMNIPRQVLHSLVGLNTPATPKPGP